ncbi:MAG: hypothetical protein KA354_23955 [Phycisphaerae bacterium]|nr:hypothetical protein [Phycisphaerae bacterium]
MTTGPDVHKAKRWGLGQLLAPDCGQSRPWRPEELEAISRHQMSVSIQYDLGGLDPGLAGKLSALASAEGLLVRSFADLFTHPRPPLELLRMTKDFAKAMAAHPESPLPREVADVLYYASILVARTRCGERISQLEDGDLMTGIDWALSQAWVEERVKTIFREGRAVLQAGGGQPP